MTPSLVLCLIAVGLFSAHGAAGLRTGGPILLRAAGGLLLGLGLLSAGWTAWLVSGEVAPLERALLHTPEDKLLLAPSPMDLAVVVRSEIPPLKPGEGFDADYTLIVEGEASDHALLFGTLSEHWTRGRSGKRARPKAPLTHSEDRSRLALDLHDHGAALHAKDLTRFEPAGLEVSVIPAPVRPTRLLVLGLLLAACGALVDGLSSARSRLAAGLAGLTLFSATIQFAVTPHGQLVYVVHAAVLSLLIGLPLGWILVQVVGAVGGRIRAVVPRATTVV